MVSIMDWRSLFPQSISLTETKGFMNKIEGLMRESEIDAQFQVWRESMKTALLKQALHALNWIGAPSWAPAALRGNGAIFMLHRVRAEPLPEFAPNRILEITPDMLDRVLHRVRDLDYDIVTLDEAVHRLRHGAKRRFAVFTFDDGYKDNLTQALPVFEKHVFFEYGKCLCQVIFVTIVECENGKTPFCAMAQPVYRFIQRNNVIIEIAHTVQHAVEHVRCDFENAVWGKFRQGFGPHTVQHEYGTVSTQSCRRPGRGAYPV